MEQFMFDVEGTQEIQSHGRKMSAIARMGMFMVTSLGAAIFALEVLMGAGVLFFAKAFRLSAFGARAEGNAYASEDFMTQKQEPKLEKERHVQHDEPWQTDEFSHSPVFYRAEPIYERRPAEQSAASVLEISEDGTLLNTFPSAPEETWNALPW